MRISTITPCHGRVPLVEKLLVSLEVSRANLGDLSESILIDSSSYEEGEGIRALCQRYGAIYLRGSLSVREKRNLGIENAQYDLILFIDSDCEADPLLLYEHVREYEQFQHISGVLGPVHFDGPKSWVWSFLKHTPFLDSFAFAEKYPYAMWGPTANLSLRKQVIQEVGQFLTQLPFHLGADDLDLTLRVTERGFHIKCNPNAVVRHTTETWNQFSAICERTWRWGRMEYYTFRNHPKLCYPDFPKPIVLILFLMVCSLLLVPFKGWSVMFVPLLWAGLYFVLDFVFRSMIETHSLDRGILIAQSLMAIYQVGTVVEFLHNRDFRFITKRTMFAPGQVIAELQGQVRRMWAVILASMITFVIVQLI